MNTEIVKSIATTTAWEMGYAPKLALLIVAAFLVFSVLIHTRRLGLHFRISLIPLSLIPVILGIFGVSIGTLEGIRELESTKSNELAALQYLGDVVQMLPQTAFESLILLVITSILLITTPKATEQ